VPPESSPVDPEIVRKIAALARLAVAETELDVWTEQLGRIVSYIDQLKELPEENRSAAVAAPTPLRADQPGECSGRLALEQNAPRLLHGHGVVPRVVGVTSSGAGGEPEPSMPPSDAPASKRELQDTDAR
jgi:aspartyl-tRNA(Asn)/glutamyl-tRNA(Gln) amidotransferase subunit C